MNGIGERIKGWNKNGRNSGREMNEKERKRDWNKISEIV